MFYTGFRIVGGFLLLAAGAVGILLPVVPAVPLLILGLILLARHFAWAHRLLQRFHGMRTRAAGIFRRMRRNSAAQAASPGKLVCFPHKKSSPSRASDRAA
jgi:uncharacterized membrane protein YbaN (DUF454 family)